MGTATLTAVVRHRAINSRAYASVPCTVREFLSDAPFSNSVSERCALLLNSACVSGWSCTHELVSEPDPRTIEKEGLAHRLGWKCTLRNVRNFINC